MDWYSDVRLFLAFFRHDRVDFAGISKMGDAVRSSVRGGRSSSSVVFVSAYGAHIGVPVKGSLLSGSGKAA